MINYDIKEEINWYAMRVTYSRALKARQLFDSSKIENFVPMHYKINTKGARKSKELVPVLDNIIFVKASAATIKNSIIGTDFIKFIYNRENIRLTVPNYQMEDFIKISQYSRQEVLFFTPNELNLREGTPIRIHSKGDALDGVEGLFLKVKGKRNKQLVISLNGLIAVAASVDIDLIEMI